MITIDFDQSEGEITFDSDIRVNPILMNLEATLQREVWEGDISDTDKGGLSIALHVAIAHFETILGFLRSASGEGIDFSIKAREVFDFIRDLLEQDVDESGETTAEHINQILSECDWNQNDRSLSEFQMRNMVTTVRRNNAAIFSVPGAGKTVEALAYSTYLTEGDCTYVIVCPRNAYVAWESEMEACLGFSENSILRATGTDKELRAALLLRKNPLNAVLINYNRLWFRHNTISEYIRTREKGGTPVVFIMDESHHFKGGKAFTSGVKRCSAYASHRLVLSGTPMPRSPADLVHQFQALMPSKMDSINEENIEEFSTGLFVRTTKDDLGLLDPTIAYISVPMDPLQAEIYDILTDHYAVELAARGNARAWGELLRLQRIIIYIIMHVSNPTLVDDKFLASLRNANPDLAGKIEEARNDYSGYGPKIRYACSRARQLASEGKKVLIWSNFVGNVSIISDELEDLGAVFIRGDVPTEESWEEAYYVQEEQEEEEETREQKIRRFKEDEDCMVLVANPAAAGEGISLHDVCHHAIYVDRTFNATQFMQSMDRIHRYGKDSEGEIICQNIHTTIEILGCEHSIDQVVHENLRRKMDRMYQWLNDTSLSPQLSSLDPMISEVELEMISTVRKT
jgi:SNF2 family DNA or RNA helicase